MSNEQHYDADKTRIEYENKYAQAERTAFSNRESVIAGQLIQLAIRKIAPADFVADSCLDLGCGLGHKTFGLHNHFKSVLGIDISENAVAKAKALYQSPGLDFKTENIIESDGSEKYNAVTAFGFSPFNVSSPQEKANTIGLITKKTLIKGKGIMVVGSFTNFSGTSPSGWFQHTRDELKNVVDLLNTMPGIHSEICFYQSDKSYLFRFGLINFVAELRKLIFQKKRNYLILIRYE